MTRVAAGPDGVFGIGAVRDLPRAEAYALVEAGAAEQLDDDVPTVEHAVDDGRDTAELPGRRESVAAEFRRRARKG